MNEIDIRKVSTKKELRDFVQLPYKLYAGNSCYVPDLESDIYNVFNPSQNSGLEFTDIMPFMAYDAQGNAVGRIVGIINHRANQKWNTRNVRFGLIEFVDDRKVSAALLSAVETCGKEHGMDQIQGPMGIFDFDKEGMLVEDFDQLSSMITIYNPPYYPVHLEALGYEKDVDWIQVCIEIPKEIPEKYARVARLSKEMFGLTVRKLTHTDIYKRGYGRKVFELLNQAYAPLFGYTELSDRQIDEYVNRYLPLIDKRLIPVVENDKEEIVGVAITMGSLSHALQKAKGRLFPFGFIHLLKALKGKNDGVDLLLVAVRPDYQSKGVNALLFSDLIPVFIQNGYKYAESNPELEMNEKVQSQWQYFERQQHKRRRAYTKKI